jgi:hypothetical protein
VTPAGDVEPWDGSAPLRWYVAADDRWHDPAVDAGVRHERVDGTAVFETRLRIPSGDAVQRVWSVADAGGLTLVEVANDSPLPIACAFTRPDVLTTRPPTDVPIQGIDLPAGTVVVPIGHRTRAVVALSHSGGLTALPGGLPDSAAVVRGWVTRTDAASRLDLPDAALVSAVRAARCEIALAGPSDPGDDPERFLLGVAELVRMAEIDRRGADRLAADVAHAVEIVAERESTLAAAALDAAGVVLAAAGERRALSDLARIIASRAPATLVPAAVDVDADAADVATVAAVERRIAAGGRLFPDGLPTAWMGQGLEAHGLIGGPSSRVSVAVRWHGPNPAVLWDVTGDPLALSCDVGVEPWGTEAPSGETLWRLPA